ncbi:unnamed protein product [Schistocephalus solidus]|uniref:Neuropeptide CCHamide-1 n=1 Tax=Schistocephalus solidus TaxID=70667 RepID=A0A183SXC0_SCHSO|nr:unnamed protein product [Schistocephalus solidus]
MSSRQLLALLISLHLSLAYAAVLYPWTYADFMDTKAVGKEEEEEEEAKEDERKQDQRSWIAKRPFYSPWVNYHEFISRLKSAQPASLKRISKRPFFNPFVYRNRTPEQLL